MLKWLGALAVYILSSQIISGIHRFLIAPVITYSLASLTRTFFKAFAVSFIGVGLFIIGFTTAVLKMARDWDTVGQFTMSAELSTALAFILAGIGLMGTVFYATRKSVVERGLNSSLAQLRVDHPMLGAFLSNHPSGNWLNIADVVLKEFMSVTMEKEKAKAEYSDKKPEAPSREVPPREALPKEVRREAEQQLDRLHEVALSNFGPVPNQTLSH